MYLDSAIIVKLLVREEDSNWFNDQLVGEEFWTSELALAEVHSAILMKERKREISGAERKTVLVRFDEMCTEEMIRFHALNLGVVERAAGLLMGMHPDVALPSLDALHLATTLIHPRGAFCTTDVKLRAAAKKINFPCFPEDLTEIVKDENG
jgi:predicted nucleic acid-binding protein